MCVTNQKTSQDEYLLKKFNKCNFKQRQQQQQKKNNPQFENRHYKTIIQNVPSTLQTFKPGHFQGYGKMGSIDERFQLEDTNHLDECIINNFVFISVFASAISPCTVPRVGQKNPLNSFGMEWRNTVLMDGWLMILILNQGF